MSDTSTVDESERKMKMEEFYFQRRILFGCTVALFFAILMWIFAMSTNRWFIVIPDKNETFRDDFIFVESHRRYFKSSYTGIWRNCRYALIPQVVSASIVRNFTTLSPTSDAEYAKVKKIVDDEFKNYPMLDLPDLDTIEEIDEAFRQHLFAEWLKKDHSKFNKLKSKFSELKKKYSAKEVHYLDPSKYDVVKNAVGDLVTEVQYNSTSKMRLLVPEALRDALFEEWSEQKYEFIRLFYPYSKSLNLDPSLYVGNKKYIFKPPVPKKNMKHGMLDGFYYKPWQRCTYHNLFAEQSEIDADPSIDDTLVDLTTTAASFSIITIFVMILGFIFTVYTFCNPRYMFKRLAGGVHFISGVSSATVCKLLQSSITHASVHLRYAFPLGCKYTQGNGFYFGCAVAAINFFSCVMFFWYSKKKKGDKAATEELGMADEAIQIGR